MPTRLTETKAMQLTINIGYDQVFELVRQLSPEEKERLAKEMIATEQKPVQSVMRRREDLIVLKRGKDHTIVQIPFPDTEEGRTRKKELERLQKETRKKQPKIFEQSKCSCEEWKQILSGSPTLPSEDAQKLEKSMKNFRREFNNVFRTPSSWIHRC